MKIFGADISGIEGQLVRFEAIKNEGKAGVSMIGLVQPVVREGLTRAAEAISTLEEPWSKALSNQGYTIDMTPSETPKTSSGLDLPLAITILYASVLQDLDLLDQKIARITEQAKKTSGDPKNEVRRRRLLEAIEELIKQREAALKYRNRLAKNKFQYLMIGKLNITAGEVHAPEHGMFGMISAVDRPLRLVVPEESEIHAALVAQAKNVKAYKVADLKEAWDLVLGLCEPRHAKYRKEQVRARRILQHIPDLKRIHGVALAKRAMEVAVAGGHHILLVGPPGQGKSMLARAGTGLLPPLSQSELFEVNKIHSAKGRLRGNEIIESRPFQKVQNATHRAIFGGGSQFPVPGLVSLAHRGILFFDEVNLAASSTIEDLRTVLSERKVEIQRTAVTFEYPSSVMLVAAMNPCKDGWLGHFVCPECGYTTLRPKSGCRRHPTTQLIHKCRCTPAEIRRYQKKLSQPLLDRIDLKVQLTSHDHAPAGRRIASSTVAKRIHTARTTQENRYRKSPFVRCNGDLEDASQYDDHAPKLPPHVTRDFRKACRRIGATPRLQDKLLFVSRTIADLDGTHQVSIRQLEEAVRLMGLENPYFSDLM